MVKGKDYFFAFLVFLVFGASTIPLAGTSISRVAISPINLAIWNGSLGPFFIIIFAIAQR